jgi:hypothetical protein
MATLLLKRRRQCLGWKNSLQKDKQQRDYSKSIAKRRIRATVIDFCPQIVSSYCSNNQHKAKQIFVNLSDHCDRTGAFDRINAVGRPAALTTY